MSKPDIIMQWCVYVDFPFWRLWLKKYRAKFNKVILYPSRQHGVIDLEHYIEEQVPETWITGDVINWTEPGLDWRQREVTPCLQEIESDWILFMEADFFCDNWDKLFLDIEKAMETADMIGWWSPSVFPYIHPCFLLIKRELLNKTNKDFRAHPEIDGSDHFAMITRDTEKLGAKIVKLQDLGWTEPEHAFHLGGLTYPYQDFKGDETIIGCKYPEMFATYNDKLISDWDSHPDFKDLARQMVKVLEEKGIKANPKYDKFLKI